VLHVDDVVDPLLYTDEIAAACGVVPGTIRQWRHKGRGPHTFHLAGRIVARRSDVVRWLREQEALTGRGGDYAAAG
jgi:predicted site-specific integrase-resolvase